MAAPWGCASHEPPQLREAGERSRCDEGTGLPHCCWSLLSSVSQAAGSFLRNCPQGAITFSSH